MNEKIYIIGGTGKMGQWLKKFFDRQQIDVNISGRKIDVETLKTADIIFISVPNSIASSVILGVANEAKKDALVVDLSSVKSKTVPVLRRIDQPSCAMHFMFGPSIDTFKNQAVIVTEIKTDKKITRFKKLIEKEGAHIIRMDEKDHDMQTAISQALTHFVNIAFAKTLQKSKSDLKSVLTTPVFLSQYSTMSRVLSQDPNLISELQIENPYVGGRLELFQKSVEELSVIVKSKKKNELETEISNLKKSFTPRKSQDAKPLVQQNIVLPASSRVGFLGPEGTYTHLATRKITSNLQKLIPYESIQDVFEAVSTGSVDFGVVPAENSTHGTVRETLDYLVEFSLRVTAQIEIPIEHNLLSSGKKLEDIKIVYSHPQALAQCRNWLQKNLPDANLVSSQSTGSEIKDNKNNTSVGFIASKEVGELMGLNVLAKGIQDKDENITKFYVIAKNINALSKKTPKTLLYVSVFNRVGILRDILNVIASMNINISKLESRPSREKMWDYDFFFEIDVQYDSGVVFEMQNVLREYCTQITILGKV